MGRLRSGVGMLEHLRGNTANGFNGYIGLRHHRLHNVELDTSQILVSPSSYCRERGI